MRPEPKSLKTGLHRSEAVRDSHRKLKFVKVKGILPDALSSLKGKGLRVARRKQ